MLKLLIATLKAVVLSFDYKLKRLFLLPAKPLFINFAFTYKCNARCRMCDNWKRYLDEPKKAQEELTAKDLEIFFRENKKWLSKLKNIGIAGGEPFLRPDLVEVVKLICEQLPKVSVGLQTNGLMPELIIEKLKKILAFCPDISLAVSLDGLPSTHAKIRGTANAYQKVIKTITLAQELGIKKINSGMTVFKDNFGEILKVKEKVEDLGVEFSCFLADAGDYYYTEQVSGLNSAAKKSVIKALEVFAGDYYLDNLRRQLLGKRKRSLPCYSGWTSLVVDPYGEVKPCVLRSESFGNIKKQSLKEILSGDKAKKIRAQIKKCSCWSICEVSTSAVVDPWDVFFWFLFYADKKEFLKQSLKKIDRFV